MDRECWGICVDNRSNLLFSTGVLLVHPLTQGKPYRLYPSFSEDTRCNTYDDNSSLAIGYNLIRFKIIDPNSWLHDFFNALYPERAIDV